MKHKKYNVDQLVKLIIVVAMLLVTATATAVSFPQYPRSIKLIEPNTLPIRMIKMECSAINVKENFGACISNTMSQWAAYRLALKDYPEIAALCYNNLKELDDLMLVNKCIDASISGNS